MHTFLLYTVFVENNLWCDEDHKCLLYSQMLINLLRTGVVSEDWYLTQGQNQLHVTELYYYDFNC